MNAVGSGAAALEAALPIRTHDLDWRGERIKIRLKRTPASFKTDAITPTITGVTSSASSTRGPGGPELHNTQERTRTGHRADVDVCTEARLRAFAGLRCAESRGTVVRGWIEQGDARRGIRSVDNKCTYPKMVFLGM
jgi:hypothetical protein